MRRLLNDIFYSFPVQLFILHFRKFQVILIFWYLLLSTINSDFMKNFGADALFFVPEYMGNVNALGGALIGVALGVFFMSWNITTFILHSKRFKFLATASKPFLKYCINNAILPILFMLFYLFRLVEFNYYKELMRTGDILVIILGILGGLVFLVSFSLIYFFRADRRILRHIAPIVADTKHFKVNYDPARDPQPDGFGMKVGYYFNTRLNLRKARNVSHYSQAFLDIIFKRHHFSGMIGIVLAFVFLITIGFFLDSRVFQVPAAASIIVFFAILVAVMGALTYFLQSWSLLFVMGLVFVLNILYTNEIIDPRNKAYGLNYNNKKDRPSYEKQQLQQLCSPAALNADKANMIRILENWKRRQGVEKPVIIFINVSGGGLRSATFVMNTLQQLDSITNGQVMKHTFMISGASGGMLAATYYRELYLKKLHGEAIDLHHKFYINSITQDLLNPIFTSMIDRDIFAPAQKFSVGPYRFVKDRGYAFEQKLNQNSNGILDKQIKDYAGYEQSAEIPMIIFNSVVTRDGRKMLLGTQPLSFMMKPAAFDEDTTFSPDAIDFGAMFKKQDPQNIRVLTALRMNATFPYILPNVWLPCDPVIDVMDAGLRDNYGQETSLRFIDNFRDWIDKNTGGVIILQMRDRVKDNFQHPLGTGSITDILVKPATMLQHNWYKLQDYFQADQYSYLKDASNKTCHRITFMYVPGKEDQGATLNFHLTVAEKNDIIASFNKEYNQEMLKELLQQLN